MSQDSISNKCVSILILFLTRWTLLPHFVALGLLHIDFTIFMTFQNLIHNKSKEWK